MDAVKKIVAHIPKRMKLNTENAAQKQTPKTKNIKDNNGPTCFLVLSFINHSQTFFSQIFHSKDSASALFLAKRAKSER